MVTNGVQCHTLTKMMEIQAPVGELNQAIGPMPIFSRKALKIP